MSQDASDYVGHGFRKHLNWRINTVYLLISKSSKLEMVAFNVDY